MLLLFRCHPMSSPRCARDHSLGARGIVAITDELGCGLAAIRELLERNSLTLHAWEKARTDRVQIRSAPSPLPIT
jgi:hypothetical protein